MYQTCDHHKRRIKRSSGKTTRDASRIEAMTESMDYFFNSMNYVNEQIDAEIVHDDSLYHWNQIENDYDPTRAWYEEWLDSHPTKSIEQNTTCCVLTA